MKYDVVIIGAGAAGTVTTYAAAKAGLSVLCLERRDLDRVGAHWINSIPVWCFEQAEIPLPSGAELKHPSTYSTLVAGRSRSFIRFSASGIVDVDMALLIQRLRRGAAEAGAELRGNISVRGLSEFPEDNIVHTSQGDIRARTVVDATGIRGLNLVGAPEQRMHICVAAQQQRAVVDLQSAKAFFDDYGVAEGEKLIFTGVEGGYSVVNLCLDGDEVGILTGSIPADGFLPGPALIQQLAREQAWIGEALRSGAGPIPLQAPIRPARGDVVAMGDQGAQVFAAHGSSLGATMVAAHMLAHTLSSGGRAELWGRRWMRAHGGRLAAAYLFSRFSMTLSSEELAALMDSGLLAPERMSAGLLQKTPQVSLRDISVMIRGAFRNLKLVARIAPMAGRIGMALLMYAVYIGPIAPWEDRIGKIME